MINLKYYSIVRIRSGKCGKLKLNAILITTKYAQENASMQKYIMGKYFAQIKNVEHNQNNIIFAAYGTKNKRQQRRKKGGCWSTI